ncbi:elongation factor P [Candidatus Woesebacteria bacterium RIFCSPHIGHO2_02_FULL_38_9]|nr:MAG: elongation factor P [Candidatus Woesebacteria bacterium RIFCSPHIGHO2_02_FULL_38_9]
MIDATDLKNGTTFLHEGKPYQVIKYTHIKLGRGGATVRVIVRNLETGSTAEKAFSSNESFEEVNTNKRKLQYLYKDARSATFMDPKLFDQVEIPLNIIGDQITFIKEGDSVDILLWDDKPLSVELPPKVILTVKETPPGVKGNSANNMYKPAILENGLSVKIPLFIEEGQKIKVDTRTSEYVERVK